MIARRALLVLGLALGVALPSALATAQEQPSVAVQLTDLKRGSLPRVVTAYGTVEPSASAQRTVMAPTAAIVDDIYVRQGEEVDKDTPLLRLSPSPATESSYAKAQSALRVASDLVARTRNMVEQHLATAQQLSVAEKSESDARAALAALQAQGAGGANVLKAPSPAIVMAVSISPGAIVAEGASLLVLAERRGLVLKVGVVPDEAGAIEPGDPVAITPLGEKTSLTAKVLLRGSLVDPRTGMIPVEIAVPPAQFVPGEAATAAITTGEVEGYVVPHDAILVDDNGHPYVVQAVDMMARQVPVRVLGADGDRDVIEGAALDASAPVVLAGNHQLRNGMKIRRGGSADEAAP